MATQRAPLSLNAHLGARNAASHVLEGAGRFAPVLGLAERRIIRRGGDLLMVASPWLVTAAVAGAQPDLASALTAGVAWLLAASIADTYRPHRAARSRLSLFAAGLTLAIAAGLFAVAATLLPQVILPATTFGFASDLALIAVLLVGWTLLYSHVVQQSAWRYRAAIRGSTNAARATARTLRRALARDYTLVGFVADEGEHDSVQVLDGVRVLGMADRLLDLLQTNRVSQLVLANEDRLTGEQIELLAQARQQGVEIVTMFDFYRTVSGRLPLEDGPAFRLAALTTPRERAFTFYALAKRGMDVAISLVGLAGVALVIPFIALANALESPGPLFYSQTRVGRGGRTFKILKFRSMIVNAERGTAQWSRPNDNRITRIGRVIRKTHLDEVPQLWNVLSGDMSFVGPRPERPEMIQELEAHIHSYAARHAVQPGLTGWAQVNYPYGNTVRDALVKLEYDLYYIQHRSLWLDVLCIVRTIKTVVLMTGV